MPDPLTGNTFDPFANNYLAQLTAEHEATRAIETAALAAAEPADEISEVTWDSYRGQPAVKSELLIRIHSAMTRGARMPHVLLVAGPGTGKTTVARLIAAEMGRPFKAVTHPPRNAAHLQALLWGCEDGVLLLDEIHQFGRPLVHATMQLLEEGAIETGFSKTPYPNLTVVAATTEEGKLFPPLVSRFGCRPQFVAYADADMAEMVGDMIDRCGIAVSVEGPSPTEADVRAIAQASAGNPRNARHLVEALRDLSLTGMPCDAGSVLRFSGVDADGLGRAHLDYLMTLSRCPAGRAGLPTLATMLMKAPEQLRQTEQVLSLRGLVQFTPAGRQITSAGLRRLKQ